MQNYGFQQYTNPPWHYPTPPINPIPSPSQNSNSNSNSSTTTWPPPPPHAYPMLLVFPTPGFPRSAPSPQPRAPSFFAQPNTMPTPSELSHQFDSLSLRSPLDSTWYIDTGASSHMALDPGILRFSFLVHPHIHQTTSSSAMVLLSMSHLSILLCSLILINYHISHTLVAPDLVKNLISVRIFTRENNCSIEFDIFGFSMKDLQTCIVTLRCNSSGDLYPVTHSSLSA